jgi:O-antigen/teichoic acid export membrane protein
VQVAANLVLSALLVPWLGVRGAVLSFIASQALVIPLFLRAIRARIDVREAVRTISIYALALTGAALAAGLPSREPTQGWIAPLLSLLAFLLIAHAGGLLRTRLTPAAGLVRATR